VHSTGGRKTALALHLLCELIRRYRMSYDLPGDIVFSAKGLLTIVGKNLSGKKLLYFPKYPIICFID